MITKINAKAETALRQALTSVARFGEDQIEPCLASLDDRERAEALSLAVIITGYVAVDACGTKWPNQASARQIAEDLATTGTVARQLQLDPEKIYQYLSRAVLGSERLQDVIPDEPDFTRFPVVLAERALAVYCPKQMKVWDYLDHIESAIEVASALTPAVLNAAVLRAYIPQPESGAQEHNT